MDSQMDIPTTTTTQAVKSLKLLCMTRLLEDVHASNNAAAVLPMDLRMELISYGVQTRAY